MTSSNKDGAAAKIGARRAASKTAGKSTDIAPVENAGTSLAVLDQFSTLVGYEPHPNKPGEYQMNKPFIKLPFNINAEGLEDLDAEDVPVAFPEVKLLHGQSQPVQDGVDGAKPGAYWHMNNV